MRGAERASRGPAVRLVPALVELDIVLNQRARRQFSLKASRGGTKVEIAHLTAAVIVSEAAVKTDVRKKADQYRARGKRSPVKLVATHHSISHILTMKGGK